MVNLLVTGYSYSLYIPLTWFLIAYVLAAIRSDTHRLFLGSIALLAGSTILALVFYQYTDRWYAFPWYLLFFLPVLGQNNALNKPSIRSIRHLDILFFQRTSKHRRTLLDTRIFFLVTVLVFCITCYGIGRFLQPCEVLDIRLQVSGCYATIETFMRSPDVSISPSRQKIAISDNGKRIEIGTVATQDVDFWFNVPAGRATSLSWSSDSRYLAAGTDTRRVFVWDTIDQQVIRDMPLLTDSPIAVAFAPDSYILATTSGTGPITLWDVAKAAPLRTIQGHHGPLYDLRFSPTGTLLAASGEQISWIFDLTKPSGRAIQVPGSRLGGWSDTKPTIATYDHDSVYISTIQAEQSVITISYKGNIVTYAGLFPNNQPFGMSEWFSYQLQGDTIWTWNVEDGTILQRWEFPRKQLTYGALSPDGRTAIVSVRRYEYATQIQLWHVQQP
jgi:hypothetical protein